MAKAGRKAKAPPREMVTMSHAELRAASEHALWHERVHYAHDGVLFGLRAGKQTGIGRPVFLVCKVCGEEHDLTNYRTW